MLVVAGVFDVCLAGSDAPAGSPVALHGQLSVQGIYLVDEKGEPVQLKGMSSFNLRHRSGFANKHVVKWLSRDWDISLYRVAMGLKEPLGYLTNPKRMIDRVEDLVDECQKLGLYVIIDWHTHSGDHLEDAKVFFDTMSKKYGHLPNVIYELWNEPVKVSWDEEIRPYMEELTAVIRKNDPDNIILSGTPMWSSSLQEAADNPLDDSNTMYVLHFYSGSHKQEVRDRANEALSKGLPIFVSEFGVSHYDGGSSDKKVYLEEADRWMQWMAENKISWANWSVCDKKEASAALKPGADVRGRWKPKDLSASGKYIRSQLRQNKSSDEH